MFRSQRLKEDRSGPGRIVLRGAQVVGMLVFGILLGASLAYLLDVGTDAGASLLTTDSAGESRLRVASVTADTALMPGKHSDADRLSARPRRIMPRSAGDRLSVLKARLPAATAPVNAVEKPKIVIIIDDIGLNRAAFDTLAALDGPLTFSVLPYAQDAQGYADRALDTGHDVMLHLPMAPEGRDASGVAGPGTLQLADSPRDLRRKLATNLDRFSGYSGVNNHMGSGLTADAFRMEIVLRELDQRGLYFVDSITGGGTKVREAAEALGLDYRGRDIFLDSDHTETALDNVRHQLAVLERVALDHGHAIGIGHPYPETVRALTEWMDEARDRGFEFVTASELVAPEKARPAVMARLR